MLYLGNNAGNLYAIAVQTGTKLWRFHAQNPLMSAPLLYGGLVIVGEGDAVGYGPLPHAPLLVGRPPSELIALDQRTGAIRWRLALNGSAMPTPTIVDGVLVEPDGAGWVVGVDPLTGAKLYARNLQSVASMTAALPFPSGAVVTAGVLQNAIWKLRARNGAVLWKTTLPANESGIGDCPPVSDGRTVFCDDVAPLPPYTHTIVTHAVREQVYALSARTGAERWKIPLERGALPPRNEAAIPVLCDGVLAIGSAVAPWMNGIDPRTGRLLWRTPVHAPVKGGIVCANGVLYFGDLAGYLWALDVRTGAVIGAKPMPSAFNVGSPLVVGRTLVIGSKTGTVFAVPLRQIRRAGRESG